MQDITQEISRYALLRDQIKSLTKEQEDIKTNLKKYVETNGKEEESGSVAVNTNVNGTEMVVRNMCKRKVVISSDAIDLLKANLPPRILSKVVEQVETIRQDVLFHMIDNGSLDQELSNKLVTVEKSYSFQLVEKKKDA